LIKFNFEFSLKEFELKMKSRIDFGNGPWPIGLAQPTTLGSNPTG
jgi:hypothetical protein